MVIKHSQHLSTPHRRCIPANFISIICEALIFKQTVFKQLKFNINMDRPSAIELNQTIFLLILTSWLFTLTHSVFPCTWSHANATYDLYPLRLTSGGQINRLLSLKRYVCWYQLNKHNEKLHLCIQHLQSGIRLSCWCLSRSWWCNSKRVCVSNDKSRDIKSHSILKASCQVQEAEI